MIIKQKAPEKRTRIDRDYNCCEDCKSKDLRKIKYIISNGRYQVRYQCNECGWINNMNLKHSKDDDSLPVFTKEMREQPWKKKAYESNVKKCLENNRDGFNTVKDRLQIVLRNTLKHKDANIVIPSSSIDLESNKIKLYTDYWDSVVLESCSMDSAFVMYCPKCNTISVVNTSGSWSCHKCHEYLGDDTHIGSLEEIIKPFKEYIEYGYKAYLNSEHWRQKREEALIASGYKCQKCGTTHNLQVHHKTYENICNEDVENDLVVLCEFHHQEEHRIGEV